MNIDSIPAFRGSNINVIIETPLGSSFKYAYDPLLGVMRVKHQLPQGYYFAFNFGFIPNTKAEDGDPLDVIVYSNDYCVSGTLIECRVVGALVANQKKDGKVARNDRMIAVPAGIKSHDSIKNVTDIDKHLLDQYENFFVSYENYRGIAFKTIKWVSSSQAFTTIKKSLRK
jgi:inorganic pyrophosphatase